MVVLVDPHDRPLGVAEKLDAHRRGLLHRAFSAFVFDSSGRLLLHKRALGKYHSEGLWTNTCCSHPRPGEAPVAAGERRLAEEMGFTCALHPLFGFVYRAELDGGLVEHEYDHVLVGTSDAVPRPDPSEASDIAWVSPEKIARQLAASPESFSVWFRIAFPRVAAAVGPSSPSAALAGPMAFPTLP